jgi:transcriptional regulator with XRE-family HTH domain
LDRAPWDYPGVTRFSVDRDALKFIIARRGLSVREVALEAGMTRKALYRLLSGERTGITYGTARAMAEVLDIDIALFADCDEEKRTSAMG